MWSKSEQSQSFINASKRYIGVNRFIYVYANHICNDIYEYRKKSSLIKSEEEEKQRNNLLKMQQFFVLAF